MYYIGVTDGKKEKWKKKAKFNHRILVFFPQYTWSLLKCTQNLKTLAIIGAENSVTKCFIGEKEKWTNKGNDKNKMLILFYTIQQVRPNICTTFQNPRRSSF